MRFAVYHPWTYLQGGIERMLVELLRRSRHGWTLYTHRFEPEGTFPELSEANVVELAPRVSVERSLGPLARAAWTISRSRLPDDDSRGLLVSSEGLGDLVATRNRLPTVCYCHTPLKILHDPATNAALRQRDSRKAMALAALGPLFTMVDRRMWRRFRHVFVSSDEIRSRLARARLIPSGPVEILPPGVDLDWFTDDGGPRERFFLVAGRVKWWKNIELAIAGLAEAHRRGSSLPMIIAGAVDQLDSEYFESLRVKASGLPVTFETSVSQERLRELYRRCSALVLPTLNEDFGMVPLEAMACGAPVIAVDSGGPRETVVYGETGWLVQPTAEAFAATMARFSSSDPVDMRAACRARAEQFTWSRFVTRLDAVMEAVASEQGKRTQGGL
ncbi:MAG: glycosyltransferase family 4 protein [Actinomycetota bacterium]